MGGVKHRRTFRLNKLLIYAIRTVRKLSLNLATRRNFRYREENCISRSKYKRSPETVRHFYASSQSGESKLFINIRYYTASPLANREFSKTLHFTRRSTCLYIYIINDFQRAVFFFYQIIATTHSRTRGSKSIKTYTARKYKLQAYKISRVAAYYSLVQSRTSQSVRKLHVPFTQSRGIFSGRRDEGPVKIDRTCIILHADERIARSERFAGLLSSIM